MKATIWTKNKCVYCEMAKALLEDHNVEYEEFQNTENNIKLLENLVPNFKTYPQIFVDNLHIGGYSELSMMFKGTT